MDPKPEVHDVISVTQFRRHVIPGEYNGVWKNVPKNRNFKKGQPVSELAESIKEEGVKEPVLVYKGKEDKKGVLLEGHHRVVAASMVGADIPVTYTDTPWSDHQIELAKEMHLKKKRFPG